MDQSQQIRLLVSGGIGAGKSALGRILASRGVPVIHTDEIGHSVLEPEGEAFTAVSSQWPQVVVEGRIDRPRLAEVVFADSHALDKLEAMTHPAIAARVFEMLREHEEQRLVAVEIPHLNDLLGEGWLRVVVVAPAETRLNRLIEKGMDPEDAAARMGAQPSDEEWAAAADLIVDNTGSIAELEAQVDELLEQLEATR